MPPVQVERVCVFGPKPEQLAAVTCVPFNVEDAAELTLLVVIPNRVPGENRKNTSTPNGQRDERRAKLLECGRDSNRQRIDLRFGSGSGTPGELVSQPNRVPGGIGALQDSRSSRGIGSTATGTIRFTQPGDHQISQLMSDRP